MSRRAVSLVVPIVALLCITLSSASAFTIRGVGTASLIGGDLTDPENDGIPDADQNYNAIFSSSEEPGFGGGEFAFNVFDNITTGGGNNKWCCGDQNNFPTNPIFIDATFTQAFRLTRFTLTSGNDTPTRDPRVWQILGSNDGTNFTPIFTQNDPNAALWTLRDQVIEFDVGSDFPAPAPYFTLRFQTTATGATTGARFQLAEIEYFADPVPEPSSILLFGAVMGLGAAARPRRA